MINGNINSFLDTGWYTESTLFFNGHVYWFEATTENGVTTFFVNRWKASLTDNMYYNSHIDDNGDPIDFKTILTLKDTDMDIIKKDFLCSNIFDGKSFWDVEKSLVWVDEGASIVEH